MSQPKRALGKGLGALLKTSSTRQDEGRVQSIPLASIVPNPFQPRRTFSRESIDDLAQSIAKNSLLQPITVRQVEDGYQIVYGERRFRACESLGHQEIPAHVQILSDQEMLVNALIENVQREDLNPIEEAVSFHRLIQEFQLTHDQMATTLGKSRAYITNSMRLLRLPPSVVQYVESGLLSPGGARALLTIESEEQLIKVASEVIVQGLNVRQIENYVKGLKLRTGDSKREVRRGPARILSSELQNLLNQAITQPYQIHLESSGCRLEVNFDTDEDLQQFLRKLLP